MNSEIYSAIDANINRCIEGIRVCEDIFRFGARNSVSAEFKNIRHRISQTISVIEPSLLLSARDISGDEQKFINTTSEMKRSDLKDLFRANIRRAIEASRVVEEFSKRVHPETADMFQHIRFSLYDLEKIGWMILQKKSVIDRFYLSLYAIIDSAFVPADRMDETAEILSTSGADIIQLRMKEAPDRVFLSTAERISKICRRNGVLFIVNDRADIAISSGADGVHVGQDDITLDALNTITAGRLVTGISVANIDEATAAAGADYIAVGPVYDTSSKDGSLLRGVGLDAVQSICSERKVPVAAIGGINESNINALYSAGITSFSVISALYRDGKIAQNTRRLKSVIESCRSEK